MHHFTILHTYKYVTSICFIFYIIYYFFTPFVMNWLAEPTRMKSFTNTFYFDADAFQQLRFSPEILFSSLIPFTTVKLLLLMPLFAMLPLTCTTHTTTLRHSLQNVQLPVKCKFFLLAWITDTCSSASLSWVFWTLS